MQNVNMATSNFTRTKMSCTRHDKSSLIEDVIKNIETAGGKRESLDKTRHPVYILL